MRTVGSQQIQSELSKKDSFFTAAATKAKQLYTLAIGESVGLSWGGRWTSFKDRPHFYDRGGKSIAQLWTEQQNLANLA